MKVRFKYSRQGELRFIGHLDIMRYFQKAMRRAGIDIRYSEGMSPHMIMSFALPLSVGQTSDCEYMDVELNTPISREEALSRLNSVMAEGIRVTDMIQAAEGKAGKAMSLVSAALPITGSKSGMQKKPPKNTGTAGSRCWIISAFFLRSPILK